MSARKIRALVLVALALVTLLGASLPAMAADAARVRRGGGEAGADISSGSLTYYADCVNVAKEEQGVQHLDRHWLYRCYSDTALAYFNYLGRIHVADEFERQPAGEFIFRVIRGKGRCWNMIADEFGRPMSAYGCFIFEEI
jgi:hypothetical protein